MGMSLGSRGFHANINMTPMIDVLLVLIIIFMVITPTTSHGLKTLVPQQESGAAGAAAPSDDIVVTVNGDRTVSINREQVALADLSDRLRRLYANHPGHPLFVRGGKTLEFQHVAEVIDIARGVGLDRVALVTN